MGVTVFREYFAGCTTKWARVMNGFVACRSRLAIADNWYSYSSSSISFDSGESSCAVSLLFFYRPQEQHGTVVLTLTISSARKDGENRRPSSRSIQAITFWFKKIKGEVRIISFLFPFLPCMNVAAATDDVTAWYR